VALPPLYKYLNVDGAKKALGNECFRFAKPSEYEDLEDMTAQSLFPDDLVAALAILADGFVDVIVETTDITSDPLKEFSVRQSECHQAGQARQRQHVHNNTLLATRTLVSFGLLPNFARPHSRTLGRLLARLL
jgi:hypothetical protein